MAKFRVPQYREYKQNNSHLVRWIVDTINHIPTTRLGLEDDVSKYKALLDKFKQTGKISPDEFTYLAERIASHSILPPLMVVEWFQSVIKARMDNLKSYRQEEYEETNDKKKDRLNKYNNRHEYYLESLVSALKVLRRDDELGSGDGSNGIKLDWFNWPTILEANKMLLQVIPGHNP
jgi:hypothetical protein